MLELRNIKKKFNPGTASETIALDNVNLTLKEGDFITVIGGNGAGKSTLMNIIAGSIKPDSGMVLLDDEDVSLVSEHKKAQYFGRVFQDPMVGTAADMTVIENLALAFGRGQRRSLFKWSYRKEDVEYFAKELETLGLGLENKLYQKVGLLSGGQRQALTLLMATIRHHPSPRQIKKDYVRFSSGNKKDLQEKINQAFIEIKTNFDAEKKKIVEEYRNNITSINDKLRSLEQDKKIRANEIKRNESLDKDAKKGAILALKEELDPTIRDVRNEKKNIIKDYGVKLKENERLRDENYRSYDVTKPVLLLDEHTAALDPKTAEKVLETTDRIVKEQNLTTIMITHNMKDAIKYGNRLIMMSKGRVVADISGEEKQKLTIEKLLDMFVTNSNNDMLTDSAIFGD